MEPWRYERAADLDQTLAERLRRFPREPDLTVYGLRTLAAWCAPLSGCIIVWKSADASICRRRARSSWRQITPAISIRFACLQRCR